MPLAQRTRRILHTVQHVHFGMARRDAAPLPQVTQILHRIGSGQRESRVEHRRHVSRIEEETVPERIIHLIRIVAEEFGVKYCHEVRAAHCAAGMSRFGFLDHRCRQDTDVVCNAREFGFSNHKRLYAFIFFMYWPHSPGRHSAPIPDESAEYAQLGPLPAENIWKRRTKPKIFLPSFLILLVRIERARLHTGPPPQSRVRWYKFNTNPVYPTCLSAKNFFFSNFSRA